MTPNQYLEDSKRTEPNLRQYAVSQERLGGENLQLLHAVMGLCTETGEITDTLKKYIFYGKDIDLVNIEEELGDLLWYAAIVCRYLRVSFEQVMDKNINKLRQRYGDKFTEERANNRNLEAERNELINSPNT